MKLYYTPGSVSLAVHIALELCGADYEAIAIDFSLNEQRSSPFLSVNPLGRVPALVTKYGVISEVPAILNYIEAEFGKNNAIWKNEPCADHYFKSQVDSFNSFMSSTVHVAHAHLWRSNRWVEELSSKADMAKKTPLNMHEYFSLIEERLFLGPWVHGEQFSSSDLYLFVVTRWLEGDGVNYLQFPKISSHYHSMLQIEEVKCLVDGLYA